MTEPQAWFHEVATHFVEAQALFHLNQAGVFTALLAAERPLSIAELSEKLGLVAAPLEVLLDYLHGVDELLTREVPSSEGSSAAAASADLLPSAGPTSHAPRYGISATGRRIFDRYGRVDPDGTRHVNLFDVRVGAYAPVWGALGGLLSGEVAYGKNLIRAGHLAAEATYKISPRMAPMVAGFSRRVGLERLVEIGVPTGLLAALAPELPQVDLVGLDVSPAAIDEAAARARRGGAGRIRFVEGDLFFEERWADAVLAPAVTRGAFVTVHMHELASAGLDAIGGMLDRIGRRFPGWTLLALEQDRLDDSEREKLPRDLWLYAQSNVLIHHLIKNARILRREEWMALFHRPFSRVIAVEPLGYLGYNGYVVALGEHGEK